jgi:hypothetical protein
VEFLLFRLTCIETGLTPEKNLIRRARASRKVQTFSVVGGKHNPWVGTTDGGVQEGARGLRGSYEGAPEW